MPETIGTSRVNAQAVLEAAKQIPTPFYIYDEQMIRDRCKQFMTMPSAFGILPRFAMKANSGKALLQIIDAEGLGIDASSLNEAKRALMAGIEPSRILLTTQEVPTGDERLELEDLLIKGLHYNACSLTQLRAVLPFAKKNSLKIGVRVHPGVGSGESVTRNTGDKYSCFGIHLSDLEQAVQLAREAAVPVTRVHVHIGSGGDPEAWRENIQRELGFIETYFPETETVNFGGGFKEARMPDEIPADIQDLGLTAKKEVEAFYTRTGRKLKTEVEPGNYIIANAGSLVCSVMDIKQTGPDGFTFVLLDGGMETITRPLLYGSRHPFTVLSKDGKVRSDEFHLDNADTQDLIVVGRCCESGDSLTLNADHSIATRPMALPEPGDFFIIGGTGAYCSSMSPFNYNSHYQAPEILLRTNNKLQVIRNQQSLAQMTVNEKELG